MRNKTSIIGKFFAKLRRAWFTQCLEWEIYNRLAPHLQRERDHGYPFDTPAQMNAQTAARDLRAYLDLIETQAQEMPKAYAEAFRYIMHRDIHERLELYVRHVQWNIPHQSRIPAFAN